MGVQPPRLPLFATCPYLPCGPAGASVPKGTASSVLRPGFTGHRVLRASDCVQDICRVLHPYAIRYGLTLLSPLVAPLPHLYSLGPGEDGGEGGKTGGLAPPISLK